MEKILCVAQEESVGIVVHLPYLSVDAAKKSELVHVAQGEVGTLVDTKQLRTSFFGMAQYVPHE